MILRSKPSQSVKFETRPFQVTFHLYSYSEYDRNDFDYADESKIQLIFSLFHILAVLFPRFTAFI